MLSFNAAMRDPPKQISVRDPTRELPPTRDRTGAFNAIKKRMNTIVDPTVR